MYLEKKTYAICTQSMYYILVFFYFTITAINLIIILIIITNVLFISYIHLPLNVHQESEIFGLNNNFQNSLNSMKQCHTNWHMCLPTVHIVHMVKDKNASLATIHWPYSVSLSAPAPDCKGWWASHICNLFRGTML